MKITKIIIAVAMLLVVQSANIFAQKLVPFQYQSQKQWDNNAKWGYMTEDRKIVLTPVFYTFTPPIITEKYIIYGDQIMDVNTGKIVWDSLEAKGANEIRGNIVAIKMPLRGAVNYQPYSFKNIKTKKLIAAEGRFAEKSGFVVTEGGGEEGVVDENGNAIVEKKRYQKIVRDAKECFVAENDYDGYKNVYNLKGEKLNAETYEKFAFGSSDKSLIIAYRQIDKIKNIYELIFLSPQGKEIGQHLYFIKPKDSFNPFNLTQSGYATSKADITLYTDKLFTETSKLKKNIVVNKEGKIIVNIDEYTKIDEIGEGLFGFQRNDVRQNGVLNNKGQVVINSTYYRNFETKGENLFTAFGINGNKYLLNSKGETPVADDSIMQNPSVYRNSLNNFMIFKRDVNKLFFYSYDVKSGKSKAAEVVQMEYGIEVDFIETAFDKYYILKIKDRNKQQYSSYIYDKSGKLVLKSEDGLWMFKDGFLIKYLANDKGDKLYLSYYDADLKPYSIIKE